MIIYFAHNAPWPEREKFVLERVSNHLLSYYYIKQLIEEKNFNPIDVVLEEKELRRKYENK